MCPGICTTRQGAGGAYLSALPVLLLQAGSAALKTLHQVYSEIIRVAIPFLIESVVVLDLTEPLLWIFFYTLFFLSVKQDVTSKRRRR